MPDKLPPCQTEAEQSLLGGIILDSSGLPHALDMLKGNEFYKESHRLIFRAIQDLFERNEPVDLVTVADILQERAQLEAVGGISYVASLTEHMGSSENVGYYARIIKEKAMLRRLILVGNQIVTKCYDQGADAEGVIAEAEHCIHELTQGAISSGFAPINEVMKTTTEQVERRMEFPDAVSGLPTGFNPCLPQQKINFSNVNTLGA
ncbi:MAG: DnaB-like helicase N-terminal domain-containing protein [Syntrophobacteraceae bacterium]